MAKPLKVVLVGAGSRADRYASESLHHPEKLKVVGIVDPDPVRRELIREKYSVDKDNCFDTVEEFVQRDKFADAVINGTLDHLHVSTSVPVLDKGYDLLLEKPFALNPDQIKQLQDAAERNGRKVVICHVLRYTPFYCAIKEAILSGELGKIVSIEMSEHVCYHHMAASFVRGKWRSEKLCQAPMLLAKSCHDMDIMLWMMQQTKPVAISSFGSESIYGAARKPEGAGERCMADCPYVDSCKYSAKGNYLPYPRWAAYVWKCLEGQGELTPERKAESLRTDNPYGKCVWDFERDGNVDHQTVIVNFANGATGSFNMIGGAMRSQRGIHIIGTEGELTGIFEDSRYVIRKSAPEAEYGYVEKEYDLNVQGDMIGQRGGHGGGEPRLVHDFIDYLNGSEKSVSCATLDESVISHLAVFKAEQARKTGTVVPMD